MHGPMNVKQTRTMFTAQLANDGPISMHDYWNKTCPYMQIRTRVLSRVTDVFSKRIKKTELKDITSRSHSRKVISALKARLSSQSPV